MTTRKPPGMTWETWAERQVRVAQENGAFDALPGFGKPLPGAGEPYDELWWVKRKLKNERISFVPPGLQLRKDVEDTLDALGRLPNEATVRELLNALNRRIVHSNRVAMSGPPANLMPLDVDRFVEIWRSAQPPPAPAVVAEPEPPRAPWWRRARRRP